MSVRMTKKWLLLLFLLIASLSAPAQVSVVRSGSVEIGPFFGGSYGIDRWRAMGGGNLTYAVSKYVLPYFEYSYFPGIGRKFTGTFPGTGNPFTASYSIPISDVHGGVHIRIPIREKPVVPYLVGGLGTLINSARTVRVTYTDVSGRQTLDLSVPRNSDFAFNAGGGIRFYLGGTGRFGFRTEAKVYKPTGTFSDSTFGKVELGLFFQLR
jgi:hypothetical protein